MEVWGLLVDPSGSWSVLESWTAMRHSGLSAVLRSDRLRFESPWVIFYIFVRKKYSFHRRRNSNQRPQRSMSSILNTEPRKLIANGNQIFPKFFHLFSDHLPCKGKFNDCSVVYEKPIGSNPFANARNRVTEMPNSANRKPAGILCPWAHLSSFFLSFSVLSFGADATKTPTPQKIVVYAFNSLST